MRTNYVRLAKYLQKCKSFATSSGTEWNVKCYASCGSRNAIYFQVCNFCNIRSNIGKTDNIRKRTNNHISSCRQGNSSDIFDNHVFKCSKEKNIPHNEPDFKLYILMVLNDYNKLLNYERMLHLGGHDTINRITQ